MKTIKLVVVYDQRIIAIPFKNIALIDEFTTGYDNMYDIGIALNDILNLRIKNINIKNIYITSATKKNASSKEYTSYLSIKYRKDNFDYESVKFAFVDYLLNHKEIFYMNNPLNIIMANYLNKYEKKDLEESDIYTITSLYLGTNYERYRMAYFTLIKEGYKIKIKKTSTKINSQDRTDLTKYNAQNEYFEYLKRYSALGEEEKIKAMDILASYPIEEIEQNMQNAEYNLFDTKNIKRSLEDEVYLLEALTNMSIQEIINVINNYQAKQKVKGKKS